MKLKAFSTARAAVEAQAPSARLYAGTLLPPTVVVWLCEWPVLLKPPLLHHSSEEGIEGHPTGESSSSVQVNKVATGNLTGGFLVRLPQALVSSQD